MKKIIAVSIIVFSLGASAQTIQYFQTGEEFCGPFTSWKNVKTDFGAKGDGVTDDAPAINAALLAMKQTQTNPYNVLYFPAGTYLVDTTLHNPDRILGDDYSGMAIIGEDPATTIIKWNGAPAGNMFELNGWYCRVSRLTFDGMNSAGRGMYHNGGFGTGCEFSDLYFRNFSGALGGGVALDFSAAVNGQAENAVLRCHFINCKYGVLSCNWNSLDEWIWYCLFQDCTYSIDLCIGYFQIYGNVFLNSKVYDIGGGNTYQSAAVNNVSFNSPCFFQKGPGYLRGNKIYTNVDSFHMVGAQLLDNIIRDGNTHYPAQRIAGLNILGDKNLFVGNIFSAAHRSYPFGWAVQPPFQNFDHGVGASFIVGHEIEKAIDNDSTTYFTTGLWQPESGLRWNCLPQTPKIVTKFIVRQGGYDHTSDPKNFQFRASNDWGNTWTVLDSESNVTWLNSEKKIFSFPNTQPFSLYEFNVLENAGGQTPGTGGWVSFAEVEFDDQSGNDITEDSSGLLTGADEGWGEFFPIDNSTVDTSAIIVPATVSLPAAPVNMHRTTFEVPQGTGDDAAAIQEKIDSAALLPPGDKPVVHIPKGTYNVDTTLVIPAGKDMQLVGDGLGSGTISSLQWTGGNTGPLLDCLGPSRVTIKDILFQISYHENAGMDAVAIEDADQIGGRIYANQFLAGSNDPVHSGDIGIYCDGVENSDVTITCSSLGSALNGVVKARGGPVLSSGGNTGGQISVLTGAEGGTQNLFSVTDGGRIDAEGMWYEGYAPTNTSGLIDLSNTSGSISIACMQWYLNNTSLPIISVNNFSGTLTLLDCGFNQVPRTEVKMNGDGSGATIFSAYNYFGGGDTTGCTADSIWEDSTFPNAESALLGCLACQGTQLDNVVNKIHNQIPDTNFVLNAVAQLRAVRTDPPNDMVPGVTDVKFFRVGARVAEGNISVHFISTNTSGISPVANSASKLKVFPDPAYKNFTVELPSQKFDLTVYDFTGRKILFQKNIFGKTEINCANFPAGVYFVQVRNERQKNIIGKVVLMKN